MIWEASSRGPGREQENGYTNKPVWGPWKPQILSSAAKAQCSIFQMGLKDSSKLPSKVTPGDSFWEPLGPNVAKNAI